MMSEGPPHLPEDLFLIREDAIVIIFPHISSFIAFDLRQSSDGMKMPFKITFPEVISDPDILRSALSLNGDIPNGLDFQKFVQNKFSQQGFSNFKSLRTIIFEGTINSFFMSPPFESIVRRLKPGEDFLSKMMIILEDLAREEKRGRFNTHILPINISNLYLN